MSQATPASTRPAVPSASQDARPVAFFRAAYQAFQRAERAAGGSSDRFYIIGGYAIRLRFAGSALTPLITPALEHLPSAPRAPPALTICIWDDVSTCTRMPPAPWAAHDYIARGEVNGFNDDRIRTAFDVGGEVLSMLDTGSNLAVYWTRDARQLPWYESGAPLRAILHWWMRNQGLQLVHAGAIGNKKGGVLLVGKGGSGKSTTALSSLGSELSYASDDYCLLKTDPEPYVHSIYNSGKINAEDIGRFPYLRPALANGRRLGAEKALYFVYKYAPQKVSVGFPIRAVLLPRVTRLPNTTLKKISSSASLLALAPSTIFQLCGAGDEAFRTLSKLVRQAPSYVLNVGTDLSQIPGTILTLLSEN